MDRQKIEENGMMRRHFFSLGPSCNVCEKCLVNIIENKGDSGECPGPNLTEREAKLVAAAQQRGFSRGVMAAAQIVRDGIYNVVYKKLQEIGDLAEG